MRDVVHDSSQQKPTLWLRGKYWLILSVLKHNMLDLHSE